MSASNMVILIGRLARDPKNFDSGETRIEKFSLGVSRKFNKEEADFIDCTAFGKTADFVAKYLRKGIKISLVGELRASSYLNKEGVKVYTTEVVIGEIEFAESKEANMKYHSEFPSSGANYDTRPIPKSKYENSDGFMQIPDGIEDELPFN